MKSVIKKQTHYSLLLMRDDKEARKYRVHSGVLRFFIWLFLLLVAGGAAGIAGGIHYWEQHRALLARYETQGREIGEMRLQLERLTTLETVLAASNGAIPQLRYTEVGVSQAPAPVHDAPPSGAPAADVPLTPAAPDSEADNGTVAGVDATGREAQAIADNATVPDNGTQTQAPGYPRISSQESPLRVTGFNGRATGQQRLSVRYELVTEGNTEQRMISGHIRYFGVFSDGTRVELSIADSEGARFSIARMRLTQNALRVPQEYRAADVEEIDVLIELTDGRRFEERFDVGGT